MRFVERSPLGWVAVLIAIALLSTLLPTYWVYQLSAAGIGALIARGIGLVTHQAGIILLCQMSFAAIGGWAASWIVLVQPELPFPAVVAAGGIAAAPFGLLLGAATVRIRGVELAVVMLGFAAALDLVLRRTGFPGTAEGTPVIPTAPFADPFWFTALTWSLLLAVHAGLTALGRTPIGLGWFAVRQSERATASLGISSTVAKTSALGAGALIGGFAGALLAGQYGLLSSEVFNPLTSMVHLAVAVMCGASLFTGAALAGTLSVLMPEMLRRLGIPPDVGNALIALGAFDILRRGNGGIAEQLQQWRDARAFREARTHVEISQPLPGSTAHPAPASPASEAPVLEVEQLTVSFGPFRALDAVDLTLRKDEVHALIGPNGAGKSTLVDAVTGFIGDYTGAVRLNGTPVEGKGARQRARLGIRRTFQQSRVIESLTVGQYLRLAASPVRTADIARVRQWFGLPAGEVPIRLMDIGSRRILELAAAVAASPPVLLVDEPAAGLDSASVRLLAERVRQIPTEFGCAVLLIEHDMSFIRAGSDRVSVLDEGQTLTSGPVEEVLGDSRVVATYLGRRVVP